MLDLSHFGKAEMHNVPFFLACSSDWDSPSVVVVLSDYDRAISRDQALLSLLIFCCEKDMHSTMETLKEKGVIRTVFIK